MSDTKFTVRLVDSGVNKITTIKAMRTAFQPMGLYEAKTIVDRAPVTIARSIDSGAVQAIRDAFNGVAVIEVIPTNSDWEAGPLKKFNRIKVELPADGGPDWIKISDLKLGEIVTIVHPSKTTKEDLRIITERGAFTAEGIHVADLDESTYYQRLPLGTTISFTV